MLLFVEKSLHWIADEILSFSLIIISFKGSWESCKKNTGWEICQILTSFCVRLYSTRKWLLCCLFIKFWKLRIQMKSHFVKRPPLCREQWAELQVGRRLLYISWPLWNKSYLGYKLHFHLWARLWKLSKVIH